MSAGFKSYSGFRKFPADRGDTVVAIGNFDGVHLGHQELLKCAKGIGAEIDLLPIAYTFTPHPQIALGSESLPELLSTYEERRHLLESTGIQGVVEEPFTREFSLVSADRFVQEVLFRALHAKAIVVGFNFSFGKGREGNLELLKTHCQENGVRLEVFPAFEFEGQAVSSSRVRAEIRQGNVGLANRLLGYRFFYSGVVSRGSRRGKGMGYPTANVAPGEKILVPLGVYATISKIGSRQIRSVTNVGRRPTFVTDGEVIVETHLLETDEDLYGEEIQVEFVERIREERQFTNSDELRSQIAQDIENAEGILNRTVEFS